MTDTIMATDPRRAVELRADVESLDLLHEQRRQLLPMYAKLKALHGPGGKFDARRKLLLESCKVRVRLGLLKNQEKVTEGLVDAMAHADEQYERFIDEGIASAIRYVELETAMSEIEEKIQSRALELTVYGREITLR